MAAPAAAASGRLVQLDGLRGVAAIAVMLYHVHNVYRFTLGFERAYLFVDLFFMLSGFVLTRASEPAMRRRPADFVLSRLGRLTPMMAIGSCLGAVVHCALGDLADVPLLLIFALAFVPVLGGGGAMYPLNGPQWSLAWEIVANLAHAYVLSRLTRRWLAAVMLVAGACFVAAIARTGSDTFGVDGDDWWLGLARVGWSYMMGMWLARGAPRPTPRAVPPWWVTMALLAGLVMLLPVLALGRAAGDIAVTVVAMPIGLWALTACPGPAIAGRALARLGALSFPLYAIHLPILIFFHAVSGTPLSAFAAAALAVLAAYAIDRRGKAGRHALRRLLGSWRRPALAAPAR